MLICYFHFYLPSFLKPTPAVDSVLCMKIGSFVWTEGGEVDRAGGRPGWYRCVGVVQVCTRGVQGCELCQVTGVISTGTGALL